MGKSNRVRARVRLRLADLCRHTPTDTPTTASGPYQQTLVVLLRPGPVNLYGVGHAFTGPPTLPLGVSVPLGGDMRKLILKLRSDFLQGVPVSRRIGYWWLDLIPSSFARRG